MSIENVLNQDLKVQDIVEVPEKSKIYKYPNYTSLNLQNLIRVLNTTSNGLHEYSFISSILRNNNIEIPFSSYMENEISRENLNYSKIIDKSDHDEVYSRLKFLAEYRLIFPGNISFEKPKLEHIKNMFNTNEEWFDKNELDEDVYFTGFITDTFNAKILGYDFPSKREIERVWDKINKDKFTDKLTEYFSDSRLDDLLPYLSKLKLVAPNIFKDLNWEKYDILKSTMNSNLAFASELLKHDPNKAINFFERVFYMEILEAPIARISNGQILLFNNEVEVSNYTPLPERRKF